MLSEFTFPKKWGKKCEFRWWWNQGFWEAMGNYAFGNLNSFFHQTNKIIFWINLKEYRQRWPMLIPSKQIPLQSLLYETTICLTWPATFYSVSQMKKSPSKTTTFKLFLQKSSPIDFLLGSKSCSWQYYQKSSHLKVISSGL